MRQSLKVGPQLTPTDSTRVDFMMKELRTFAMTVKVIDYSIRELKASMVGSTGGCERRERKKGGKGTERALLHA